MNFEELSEVLREELARRCERNPRYSLRAFAKSLSIEPGALSRIMAGKRRPTANTLDRILRGVDLSPEIQDKLKSQRSTSRTKPLSPQADGLAYKELSVDVFRVIAEMYHYSILQLPFTKLNTADPRIISKRLGISQTEAKLALRRLINLGLLEVKKGKLVRTEARLNTADKHLTTSAHKRHQKQSLQKAIESIDDVSLENRNATSMTLAIDPKQIPNAKLLIQKFTDQLSRVLETGSTRKVYQFGVYLYPLEKESLNQELI